MDPRASEESTEAERSRPGASSDSPGADARGAAAPPLPPAREGVALGHAAAHEGGAEDGGVEPPPIPRSGAMTLDSMYGHPDLEHDARDEMYASMAAEREAHRARMGKQSRLGRGDTALGIACLGGDSRYDMVKLLSSPKYGGFLDFVSDVDGGTPLHRCAESGAIECAKLLHERGGNILAETAAGHSVVHIALQHGHPGFAEWAMANGAKPCRGRCMKCQLSLKLLKRRRAAQNTPTTDSPQGGETMEDVLEEEFGDISLADEIAKLKQEGEAHMQHVEARGEGRKQRRRRRRRRKKSGKGAASSGGGAAEGGSPRGIER